jgi:serralysin
MNHFNYSFSKKLCALLIGIHAFFLLSAAAVPAIIDTDVPKLQDDPPRVAGGQLYAMPFEAFSGDPVIDALLSGFQWSESIVTYSFYSDTAFGGTYYGEESVGEVSETVKSHYRRIFEWLGNVVDIEFQEVEESYPSTYGMIRIMLSDGPGYAYSYYPTYDWLGQSGDIHLNPAYQNALTLNGFETPPGYHGYNTLLHELGHALGLKHSFEDGPTLPLGEDNQSHTVMTYTFSDNSPATYMTYDVMALQYMYGMSTYQNTRTHYEFDTSIDRYYLSGALLYESTRYFKQTLWDNSGMDTLDLSMLASESSGYRIDMRPGGWLSTESDYNGATFSWGVALCKNTFFENVINSSSDDTFYLNGQPNRIGGYAPELSTGHDRIADADTQDTIDLSAFRTEDVVESRDGDDLLLALNHNSSIRIVGYYTGSTPRITFFTSMAPIYHLLLE